ncbi:carbohydrate kinase [Microbacterium sp. MEC084]|nr:carbohydrate kinase [Microbacterium sp. MEC084]
MLVVDAEGAEVVSHQVPTPWRAGDGGTTEMDAAALLDAVRALLREIDVALAPRTDAPIEAIAIAGMGETGILIDAEGAAVAPGFAWFDPRGAEQAAAFPDEIRAEFAGRTGLPLGAQVTVAKLAYLRDAGVPLAGTRWLNLPEFVAASLGGDVALEYSLTSRTGLLDQDSGRAWPAMLEALGLDETFLPPLRGGGMPWGRVDAAFGARVTGALLTVAGHDHLVAAAASGTLDTDGYHVSIGTAEVLLRVLDAPLGFAARQRLADALINEVRHIVPGKHVLVAGAKTGLLLRRALQAAGVSDRAGRDQLDAAVMAAPLEGTLPAGAIEVAGARNDDGVLRLTLHTDGATPAEIFGAVLRHSNDEVAALVQAMDREVAPAAHATLTGGWAGMASVRRARAAVLPDVRVSARSEETAFGAARIARALVADHTVPA